MKTIRITKKDLDENNYYKEDGIGTYLSPENVEIIRKSKKPSRFLGKKFKVSKTTILNIKNNKVYAN